jgi:hypothetical protein
MFDEKQTAADKYSAIRSKPCLAKLRKNNNNKKKVMFNGESRKKNLPKTLSEYLIFNRKNKNSNPNSLLKNLFI